MAVAVSRSEHAATLTAVLAVLLAVAGLFGSPVSIDWSFRISLTALVGVGLIATVVNVREKTDERRKLWGTWALGILASGVMLWFATVELVQPHFRAARLRVAAPAEFAAYEAARKEVLTATSRLREAHSGMWLRYDAADKDPRLSASIVDEARADARRRVVAVRDKAVARLEAAKTRLTKARGSERVAAAAEVQAATEAIVPAVIAAAREYGEPVRRLESEHAAAIGTRRNAGRRLRQAFPSEWTAYQIAARAWRGAQTRLREIAPREWEAYLEFTRP